MNLNFKEFKRFEKQIILKKIGISGQKKIKKAKILIVGLGGLGCPLVSYLAASGIGNICIVDHDKVELGNLNRQILFNNGDLTLGLQKEIADGAGSTLAALTKKYLYLTSGDATEAAYTAGKIMVRIHGVAFDYNNG